MPRLPRPRMGPQPPAPTGAAPEAPVSRPEPGHPVISVRTLVVAALLVLLLLGLVAVLRELMSVVLLFLVAVVFAEGIRPLVHRMQRHGLPKVVAILAVLTLLLAATAGLVALLIQPIVSEAEALAGNVPAYQRRLVSTVDYLQGRLHLNSDYSSQVSDALNATKDLLLTIGAYIFSFAIDFIVVLVLAFLWLTTSDRLKLFVVDLFPTRYQALTGEVLRDVGFRMGGYLRAVAINGVAVGLVSAVACAVLGLPSPVLLGVFVGLTSVIPLVGPVLGALPPVLLGFTVSPLWPLVVAIVFTVITLVDGNTVVPVLMNRVLSLPALGVVLALLVGGALAGLVGALLAVPLAAAIQILVVRIIVPAIHQHQGRGGGLIEAAEAATARAAPPPGVDERRRAARV